MNGLKAFQLSLLIVWGATISLPAQKPPIKFGDIDVTDLKMIDCIFEPGAPAMVLCDYGEIEFTFKNHIAYTLKRHKRIKIFTKKGFDQANIGVVFYSGESGDFETVRAVKGRCYFLENGQVRSLDLDKKDIYTNEIGYGYREIKFAIPGVREGCVIEYTYEFNSHDLDNPDNWYFQGDIPAQHNELRMAIPLSLVYRTVVHGELPLSIQKEKKELRRYQVQINNTADASKQGVFEEPCTVFRWGMDSIPSLLREPDMGPPADLCSHIEFQLMQKQFDGVISTDVISSYAKFNEKLLNHQNFGKYAEPGRFEKKLVDDICQNQTNPRATATAILQHLSEKIRCNGSHSKYAGQSPESTYSKGAGSVAEINLLAVSCLRAAGLKADPILIGTRDHARPHPVYPNGKRFNYVAVVIEIDSQLVFADATQNQLPPGYLPKKCLNGDGFRVSKHTPGFIPLQEHAQAKKMIYIDLKLEDDQWSGKASFRVSDYAAAADRYFIQDEGQERYQAIYTGALADWNPGQPEIKHTEAPLTVSIEVPIRRDLEKNSTIYFHPTGVLVSNPLVAESRHWPLNFPYSTSYHYVLTLTVPEGYTVAEQPANTLVVFGEEKDPVFSYRCSVQGNQITVISKLQMKRYFFLPDDYPELRKFYDLIVQKNQEMIVLKKT